MQAADGWVRIVCLISRRKLFHAKPDVAQRDLVQLLAYTKTYNVGVNPNGAFTFVCRHMSVDFQYKIEKKRLTTFSLLWTWYKLYSAVAPVSEADFRRMPAEQRSRKSKHKCEDAR